MPKASAEIIEANVLKEHGWASAEEMQKSPEWARALEAAKGDPSAALEVLCKRTTTLDLPGFFVRNTQRREYSEAQGRYVDGAAGVTVLLANGRTVTVYGKALEGASPIQTRVQVKNLALEKDLATGYESIRALAGDGQSVGTKVFIQAHEEPVPDVPLARSVRRAWFRNKRGVSVGNTAALVVATIDQVSYFEAKDGRKANLTATARDSEGNPVSIKLPIEATMKAYGIKAATPRAFRGALEGEPVVAYGRLSVTSYRTADQVPEVIEALPELEKKGLLKQYRKARDGTPLRALNLRGSISRDEQGRPTQDDAVVIGTTVVHDIRERRPGEFEVYVPVKNNLPTLDAVVKSFTYKQGPSAGQPGTMNDGAFVVYPNAGRKENNPFFQVAKRLGLTA